jgi:hypothetical protein
MNDRPELMEAVSVAEQAQGAGRQAITAQDRDADLRDLRRQVMEIIDPFPRHTQGWMMSSSKLEELLYWIKFGRNGNPYGV